MWAPKNENKIQKGVKCKTEKRVGNVDGISVQLVIHNIETEKHLPGTAYFLTNEFYKQQIQMGPYVKD